MTVKPFMPPSLIPYVPTPVRLTYEADPTHTPTSTPTPTQYTYIYM